MNMQNEINTSINYDLKKLRKKYEKLASKYEASHTGITPYGEAKYSAPPIEEIHETKPVVNAPVNTPIVNAQPIQTPTSNAPPINNQSQQLPKRSVPIRRRGVFYTKTSPLTINDY
jgi:hypothetical protein